MRCPHCGVTIFEHWTSQDFTPSGTFVSSVRFNLCPACLHRTVEVALKRGEWERFYPKGSNRGPVPAEVPSNISADYVEACNVLPISAKASAALSRRCLQAILRAHGYKAKDLAKEIDLLLEETDPRRAIPETLRVTVDGIRHFGNFSAHPITDVTTLQIIDVEPEEAEWCLEVLEECFDFFYVRPAQAAVRKAALDQKLARANKPSSKG